MHRPAVSIPLKWYLLNMEIDSWYLLVFPIRGKIHVQNESDVEFEPSITRVIIIRIQLAKKAQNDMDLPLADKDGDMTKSM